MQEDAEEEMIENLGLPGEEKSSSSRHNFQFPDSFRDHQTVFTDAPAVETEVSVPETPIAVAGAESLASLLASPGKQRAVSVKAPVKPETASAASFLLAPLPVAPSVPLSLFSSAHLLIRSCVRPLVLILYACCHPPPLTPLPMRASAHPRR